jgi:hypothetical protein
MGATIAVIMAARERVLNYLRADGAVSPQTAVAKPPLRRNEARQWDNLLAAGVVKDAGGERYYVDEEEVTRNRRRGRRAVTTILWLILLPWLALVLWGLIFH